MSARDVLLEQLLPDEIRVPIGAVAMHQAKAEDAVIPLETPPGRSGRERAEEVRRIERRQLTWRVVQVTVGGLVLAGVGLWLTLSSSWRPAAEARSSLPSAAGDSVLAAPTPAPPVTVPAIAPPLLDPSPHNDVALTSTRSPAKSPVNGKGVQASASVPPPMVVLRQAPAKDPAPTPARPSAAQAIPEKSLSTGGAAKATQSEPAAGDRALMAAVPVRDVSAQAKEDGASRVARSPASPSTVGEVLAAGDAMPAGVTVNARFRDLGLVTLMPGAAVVVEAGSQRRVQIGEPLPTGEVLIGVDAASGRIVTSRRTVQLAD